MTTASSWEEGLPHVLWRLQQAVHSRVQEALDGLGVTVTQLGLAVHLDELGLLSASDLSRRFRITPQSVTTALGRLESLGWVRRLPHPVHRRVILYELTERGLAGVADGRARRARVDQELGAVLRDTGLTDRDQEELTSRLRALTVALDGDAAQYEAMWPVARPNRPRP